MLPQLLYNHATSSLTLLHGLTLAVDDRISALFISLTSTDGADVWPLRTDVPLTETVFGLCLILLLEQKRNTHCEDSILALLV